jgi:hypothetical protein
MADEALKHETTLSDALHLSFLCPIHCFDSTQGSFRTTECFEFHDWLHNSLNCSIVLLNHVIQIFAFQSFSAAVQV